jgi:hypothetical protein
MKRSSSNQWMLICSLVALAGCTGVSADYSKLDLASVSGTVTFDGQPLPNAYVVFEAEDKTFSFGSTDANGQYTLQFNSERAGTTLGAKVVRITSNGAAGEVYEQDPDGVTEAGTSAASAEKIPAKYNTKSELKATVESGSNTFDFELKTAP